MFRAARYSNMLVPNPHCMPPYTEDHNLHNYLDLRCPLLLPNTTININKNQKNIWNWKFVWYLKNFAEYLTDVT
jgi:hypothetical protein